MVGESDPRGEAGLCRYLPIAEHGVIGGLRTVALVGSNGTIDWYCCLSFDAPSVFGAIVDADRGGSVSWPLICRHALSSSTFPTPTC